LLALAIGGAGGTAVVVILESTDTSEADAAEAIRATHSDLTRVARQFERSRRIAEVSSAAGAAKEGAESGRRRLAELADIADRRTRDATRAALTADVAALDALAGLTDLRGSRLAVWDDVSSSVQTARTQMDQAAPAITRLSLESVPAPPVQVVARAHDHLDALLPTAQRRHLRWRRRFVKARRERNADLTVLEGYAQTMRGHVAEYSSLRSEMSTWIEKVDSDGVTFEQAYDYLADASSSRGSVRTAIGNLDPPAAVASQHNELLATVDQAVAAVDAAYEGTVDFQFDLDEDYSTYRDAPGWETFKTESGRISGRFSRAQAAWESAIASARGTIRGRGLPEEPDL
jgi:hypothetical protein